MLHPLLQESLEIKSMKLGLKRMEAVDHVLGSPSRLFPSVQIAGTNGKGSVSTKIAYALQVAGKKIGLYTSPHIHSYHERIQINGVPIPEESADKWLQKIVGELNFSLSYFELMTLLAFCYFAEERVDFAVLETGLGGRLDATTIVTPLLSVITSIEKDHLPYLGSTYEAIASEKAGIIKPGVPVLLGPHAKPIAIFETRAAKLHSPLFQVSGEFAHYEEENRAIARQALTLLPFPLENSSIVSGLNQVPPCRFEMISSDPSVILDVAHNPDGLKRTFERLHYSFPEKRVRVLAGFSADKEVEEALGVIRTFTPRIHLTHTGHPRLLPLGEPVEAAFEKAFLAAKRYGEILLVCGTFFIMDQVLAMAQFMRGKRVDDL